MKNSNILYKCIVSSLMLAIGLLWVVPFYFLFITIFKTPLEYAQNTPLSLPHGIGPAWQNISDAWVNAKMGIGMLNSFFYGAFGAAFAVFFALLAAHGLSRYEFRRKNLWFMLIFSGTIFPFQMYLIPLFFSYRIVGLLDTHFGMLLLYTAICIPFPVLVLKNYLNQLPNDMDESARMDGCNEFKIFLHIILPNCWGPIIALFLLQFTWIWNDLIFSIVLSQSQNVRSIMASLLFFQGAYSSFSQTVVMAAAALASIPTVILFFLLRKKFMTGMQISTS